MNRFWQTIVHGVAKSQTQLCKQTHTHTHTHTHTLNLFYFGRRKQIWVGSTELNKRAALAVFPKIKKCTGNYI